jgi:hypothetical protein
MGGVEGVDEIRPNVSTTLLGASRHRPRQDVLENLVHQLRLRLCLLQIIEFLIQVNDPVDVQFELSIELLRNAHLIAQIGRFDCIFEQVRIPDLDPCLRSE